MKSKNATVKKPVKRKRPKVDRTPKEGMYMGLEYESFCELSCIFFAEELIAKGYVNAITRAPSYILCDPVVSSYAEQLKRGSKVVTQTVAKGVTYTPDYVVWFTDKALGLFCWDINSGTKWNTGLLVGQYENGLYKATIEVKPDFQRNSTTPKSVQSMKWLHQKHGVFVNLFRPNHVFEKLFVPTKYMTTETGGTRRFKFNPKTLSEYLKTTK